MSALDDFTPRAATVIKVFAYAFRSAPTADLVAWGADELNGGRTVGGFLDFLFNFPVPQSPFTAYSQIATNTAFCTALVDNFCFGTSIGAAVKAGWVAELVPLVPQYASRGELAVAIAGVVDNYAGSNADVLALKAALAARTENGARPSSASTTCSAWRAAMRSAGRRGITTARSVAARMDGTTVNCGSVSRMRDCRPNWCSAFAGSRWLATRMKSSCCSALRSASCVASGWPWRSSTT